jgi:ABC-type nitrate/sulfonate/bicarbonate transport system permease component
MLVPVFFVLFKIGTQMELATIVFGSVWPVLVNAVDGARSVDATKVATGRAFRIGRVRWITTVVLPAAAPKIFAGLRISLAIALVLMVVAELIGSTDGLGYRIVTAQDDSTFPIMWAGIVTIATIGYVFNRLLVFAERRVLSWHPLAEG